MRHSSKFWVGISGLVVLASVAGAQKIPTGTLRGTVTDGAEPLPGVTVSITSPNLQGARVTTTTLGGDYLLDLLPSGTYEVRFALDGFQSLDATVRVPSDVTSTIDAVMVPVGTVSEEITVTGSSEAVTTSATPTVTLDAELVQSLPVNRDVVSLVRLAPGAVAIPGFQAPSIAGAVGAENLYLIDGAAFTRTAYGTFLSLYIEDAIRETSTAHTGVSAEFGRFTGGVVNVLTKSGGNEAHGSLRLNLTNPSWTAETPLTTVRADEVNRIWEGTLGGYVLRDRLWYFLAGRSLSTTTSLETQQPVGLPVDQKSREDRYEGKVTWSPRASHTFVGSYLGLQSDQDNYYLPYYPVYDSDSLYDRKTPQHRSVLNYTGVLSQHFFVEAQHSARRQTFEDEGSRYTDAARGTPVYDLAGGALYNSPIFCAVCPGATSTNSNENYFVKGSAFLSTARHGSHDLRVGVDVRDDVDRTNNWQSGSGYYLDVAGVWIVGSGADARYYPAILPEASYFEYYPIPELSQGTHLGSESAFVHDVWRLSSALTLNLGLRFDRNDATDASGTRVSDDSKWSPRLSVAWDPRGDGATQVVLGYAQYLAGLSNAANSQATGGAPQEYLLLYMGPPINELGPELETRDALLQAFAWLDGIGGVLANPDLWLSAKVPGYQTFIGDDLRSPGVDQWSLGISRRLGTVGVARLDLVDRRWTDFYSARTDLTTGRSVDPVGNVYDRVVIENSSKPERTYQAAILQADARLGARLRVGGSYTLSRLHGNDGNTGNALPLGPDSYPEYQPSRGWFDVEGDLAGDRRHSLVLFGSWDALETEAVSLNLGFLQTYQSGRPYGASGQVYARPYVSNPGYATPPLTRPYLFTGRDTYRSQGVASTGLAATFALRLWRDVEVYLNAQIQNLFDNQAVISPDLTVITAANNPGRFARFNPFAETPRECPQGATCTLADGYHWQKSPSFGKARSPADYQTPRTYLFNVGLRF